MLAAAPRDAAQRDVWAWLKTSWLCRPYIQDIPDVLQTRSSRFAEYAPTKPCGFVKTMSVSCAVCDDVPAIVRHRTPARRSRFLDRFECVFEAPAQPSVPD